MAERGFHIGKTPSLLRLLCSIDLMGTEDGRRTPLSALWEAIYELADLAVADTLTIETFCARLSEAGVEEPEDLILRCRPHEYPGRSLVELDWVGDSGFWIRDVVPLEELFGDREELSRLANDLATLYFEALDENGIGGFDNYEGDEMEDIAADVASEFLSFLEEWRKDLRAIYMVSCVNARKPFIPADFWKQARPTAFNQASSDVGN